MVGRLVDDWLIEWLVIGWLIGRLVGDWLVGSVVFVFVGFSCLFCVFVFFLSAMFCLLLACVDVCFAPFRLVCFFFLS